MASSKKPLKPLASTGSVKQTVPIEQAPRLKVMTSVYRDQSTLKLHGNRMSVPPLKSVDTNDKGMVGSMTSTDYRCNSGATIKSLEPPEKRELKEVKAKEKQLHARISNQNKIIEDLKKQIRQKDTTIDDLEVKIKMQDEDYKQKLLKESHSHIQTKCSLEQKNEHLTQTKTELDTLRDSLEQQKQDLKHIMEKKVADLKEEQENELSVRDKTLRKLKKQMADALLGNSKERQVQLEELTKELARVQGETEMLTFKLRAYRNKQLASCPGCKDLNEEVNRLKPLCQRQDETIKDLQMLCAKLEHQLMEQDELLKQWDFNEELKRLTPP